MGIRYQVPTKSDVDRVLTSLVHEARHTAKARCDSLLVEFARRGTDHSSMRISSTMKELDDIHRVTLTSMMRALHGLLAYADLNADQGLGWASPHLQSLGVELLHELPSAGFPEEMMRVRTHFDAVFRQRVQIATTDFLVGFIDGEPVPSDKGGAEMLELKPGAFGFRLDLKELLRRGLKWRAARR